MRKSIMTNEDFIRNVLKAKGLPPVAVASPFGFDGGDDDPDDDDDPDPEEEEAKLLEDPAIKAAVTRAISKATASLKKTNRDLKAEKKDLRAKLDRFIAVFGEDLDDDELQEMKTKLDSISGEGGSKDADRLEALRQQLTTKHERAIAEKDQRIATLEGRLREELVDSRASRSIAAERGTPELLMHEIRRRTRVDEDEGEFTLVILEEDGESEMFGEKGEPATMDTLVKSLKMNRVFGRAFDADDRGGGGSDDDPAPRTQKRNPWKPETFNLTEQARIEKEDPALAKTLKRQAGKA